MTNRGLLVGINDYQSINDLRGCHNDVVNLRSILKEFYGFTNDDLRILTDNRATRENILHRMDWLLEGSKAGDRIFMSFSGHGCFSGDTKISLLNGNEVSLEELEKTHKNKEFWVYSIDKRGNIVPGKAHSPRITKYAKVCEVVLDSGEIIKCTEDHKFMLRDGTYKEAGSLNKGTSLMPLYRQISEKGKDPIFGYEKVYNPARRKYDFTHRVVAYHTNMYTGNSGVIHHIDFDKLNNSPENLEFMSNDCKYCWEDELVLNHKVKEVRYVSDLKIPVYDITVDEYHNFALSAGVFVHNSQIADRDGDELRDHKDEILCMYNMSWDHGYISDDEFDDWFGRVPQGVTLELIFDCCHSGTDGHANIRQEKGITSSEVSGRFLPPPLDIEMRAEGDELSVKRLAVASFDKYPFQQGGTATDGFVPSNITIWSGCGESQTSADAYINGSYNGAFTYYWCKHIREVRGNISRQDLLFKVKESLRQERYTQIPEVCSNYLETGFLM